MNALTISQMQEVAVRDKMPTSAQRNEQKSNFELGIVLLIVACVLAAITGQIVRTFFSDMSDVLVAVEAVVMIIVTYVLMRFGMRFLFSALDSQ